MKEGDKRVQIARRHICEFCGELATKRLTFLLPNCRSNPASKAHGHDDCSWCSDKEIFVCDDHLNKQYELENELGMKWCSEFPYKRFNHLFLFWETIKEA